MLSGPCITRPELRPFSLQKVKNAPCGHDPTGSCYITFSVCDFHEQNLNLQSRDDKCLDWKPRDWLFAQMIVTAATRLPRRSSEGLLLPLLERGQLKCFWLSV